MMDKSVSKILFSLDMEDFPVLIDGKPSQAGRVAELTEKYLSLLDRRKISATFFISGQIAEKYSDIVRMLIDRNYEVASHGFEHIPLQNHTPRSFEEDLEKSLKALSKSGAVKVVGFRAPYLSMISKTEWAYGVLKKMGFTYSSSVLPGYNPLFGWKGFGVKPKLMDGIWELPITPIPGAPMAIPMVGGVYFRVLPFKIMDYFVKRHLRSGQPILSYFHPYDIDDASISKIHTPYAKKPISNKLIFYNRADLLRRLDLLFQKDLKSVNYKKFVEEIALS